ncbi:hypothetical protein B5P45_26075 [Phyllobacterium zundukense]|uniref:DUF5710 domain-containing protein n=2 Tax=Phyllobacterium zundukense TaxID=1867719 RepID=A0A2N9VSK8_9HYPH|nr:hypothetical protein BLM14_15620 [Phyllobacterium zundukense]PIO42476.1 hypothetical protein B5P45_26075 [Phyllobacterium zundukense]
MESRDVNVFEMFVAHGAGFWVRRTTWVGTCARVVRVGAMTAPGPYFGNPSVLMDVYTLDGQLTDEAAQLPAAGTYKTWRQIEPPVWAVSANLRQLEDPALDAALARFDKKRHKSDSRQGADKVEKIWLVVTYAQKEEAKKLGARWSPTEKAWWLPASNSAAIDEARKLPFLSG